MLVLVNLQGSTGSCFHALEDWRVRHNRKNDKNEIEMDKEMNTI
jgi:hypothetical protein